MREKRTLPIEQIKPNAKQPRHQFDEDALFELAQSIRVNGLLQPIVVREVEGGYEIIAGERRYRASILAGFTEIEAIIDSVSDDMMTQLALIENIQREDLSVIEEAKAYASILSEPEMTQSKLSNIVGKSQPTIANKLRLLELPDKVIEALDEKRITERHGRALLTVDQEMLDKVFESILKNGLSVKQTEELIKRLEHQKKKPRINLSVYTKPERIAVNTIKEAVNMIKKTGLAVELDQIDQDDEITLEIKIKRKGG